MNFRKLKLGTKVVSVILVVIIACLGVMSYIIISRSSAIQIEETHKLLNNTAARFSNLISGYFNEMFAVLEVQQDALNGMLGRRAREEVLQKTVETMLDSAGIANFGYLYVIDEFYSGENIRNPNFKLSNGNLLILATDSDPQNLGGTKILKADNAIIEIPSVIKALQSGEPNIGIPTSRNIAGEGENVGLAMNYPLKNHEGKVIAILGLFVNLNTISENINLPERSVFKGDYKVMLTSEGRIAAHLDQSSLGKLLSDINPHESTKKIMEAVKKGDEGIYQYFNSQGDKSLTAIDSFRIGMRKYECALEHTCNSTY